jgi:DNA-binding CsgD family transcriptional regulator
LTNVSGPEILHLVSEGSDPKNDGDSPKKPEQELEPEAGPRVSRMRVGDEDVLVLSVPLPRLRYPEGTTSAEHVIIDLVCQGLTAKEIATKRGASLRTVTTQLGTIFRKANVNSQAELIAIMTHGPEPEAD